MQVFEKIATASHRASAPRLLHCPSTLEALALPAPAAAFTVAWAAVGVE
jgi:hypothetical protein